MNIIGKTIDKQYRIQAALAKGGMGEVYTAIDQARDNRLVAIKVLKRTSQRMKDIVRFQSEFEKLSAIDHPNIVRILHYGSIGESYRLYRPYIVMEYLTGQSLAEHLKKQTAFTLDQIVTMIAQLCAALECIHARNIIHGELKPGNLIMVTDTTGGYQVKLVDSGLAHFKNYSRLNLTDETFDSFYYMPPEQSGLIGHGFDERSDLYSLGIIFYELLTCRLPFKSASLMGLLQQQIAKVPVPPSEYDHGIPPILDNIVGVLLEKESEKRYQGVEGLLSDLKRFSMGEKEFPLRRGHHSMQPDYMAPLIGMEDELARLRSMLDQALNGKGSLCLISGDAGIGKTKLVGEFQKHVLSHHAIVIKAGTLERETKIPWQLFKDSLSQYLKYFERYDDSKKATISRMLKRKYNYLGRVIMQLNPELEMIFGDCPALSEIEPESEMQRFYRCITQFLCFLAEIEKGLVIIFEDLHWADEGSLRLIKELAGLIAHVPICVVGTFRSDEAAQGSETANAIAALSELPLCFPLVLRPFSAIQMDQFISNIFHGQQRWEENPAPFLFAKSRGNPLFAMEIAKHLVAEEIIYHGENGWAYEEEWLHRVDIPATIVDMLIKRSARFGSDDNKTLSIASVVGKTFNTELLLKLANGDQERVTIQKVIHILAHAEKNQLLERDDPNGEEYRFTHDRIRDAFYAKASPQHRKKLHGEIVAYLEKNQNTADEFIYEMAYHAIESEDHLKIIEYAHPAALKALKEYDYQGALAFLTHVRRTLESTETAQHAIAEHPLWLECMQKIGQSHLSIGMVDAALDIFNRILPYIQDKNEKAQIYQQLMMAYFRKCDFNACEHWAISGLALFNESLPTSKLGLWGRMVKEFIVHLLYTYASRIFIPQQNRENNRDVRWVVAIYSSLFWIYSFYNVNKVPVVVLRMLNLTQKKIGPSKELVAGYCQYGLLGLSFPPFTKPNVYFEKAYAMSQQLAYDFGIGQSLGCLGAYHLIRCEFTKVIDYCEKSIEILTDIGDFLEIEKAGLFLFSSYYLISDYQNAERVLRQCRQYFTSTSDELIYVSIGVLPYYYIETGQFEKAETMLHEYSAIQKKTRTLVMYCASIVAFGHLYTEKGDTKKALDYFEKALEMIKKHRFPMHFLHIIYPYYSVALILDYQNHGYQLSNQAARIQLRKIKRSCWKGLYYSKVWHYHSNYAYRAYAQYLALIGKDKRAEKYFKRCLKSSQKMGKRNEQALTRYLYGLFLRDTGRIDQAWSQLESAYRIFETIGLVHYQKRIAEILGMDNDPAPTLTRLVREEKKTSILKFGNQLADVYDYEKLLDIIILKAMEITGAQTGGLFLCQDDDPDHLRLEATKTISNGATLDYSKSLVQNVFKEGQTIITTDAEDDGAFVAHSHDVHNGIKSILCTPLKHNDLINGVCYLHNPLARDVFQDEDVQLLGLFLSYGAIAIENALLRKKLSEASRSRAIAVDAPMEKKITRALDYIENNFKSEISRDALAKDLSLEPNYLGRAFKAHTGRSIRDHVNELRVHKSLDQLLTTDKKIIDIAFSVGFESLRSFNRSFYQIMGETPSKIRERKKGH